MAPPPLAPSPQPQLYFRLVCLYTGDLGSILLQNYQFTPFASSGTSGSFSTEATIGYKDTPDHDIVKSPALVGL